jgi:hypothetical protein
MRRFLESRLELAFPSLIVPEDDAMRKLDTWRSRIGADGIPKFWYSSKAPLINAAPGNVSELDNSGGASGALAVLS